MPVNILAIESSCDDTAAAVLSDRSILSSVIANQDVHREYGGVVPELASRAHQQNIIPIVDQALKSAGLDIKDIHAVAFTRGPGLLGSLLVGTSFAKGLSLSLGIPMIEVNHLQAHILVHFIKEKDNRPVPEFPFLCLLVSGGHTQLVLVRDHLDMEVIGQTIDDAAGEAFDKCGKLLGLPYPAGPAVDKLAQEGNERAFGFARPRVEKHDYSFSGLKTSFLYFLRDRIKEDRDFVEKHKADLCASLQHTIIDILVEKLEKASKELKINQIALAGGVSANSGLRKTLLRKAQENLWKIFIPEFRYTTDNAAMIAITGYYKYLNKQFSGQEVSPLARWPYE